MKRHTKESFFKHCFIYPVDEFEKSVEIYIDTDTLTCYEGYSSCGREEWCRGTLCTPCSEKQFGARTVINKDGNLKKGTTHFYTYHKPSETSNYNKSWRTKLATGDYVVMILRNIPGYGGKKLVIKFLEVLAVDKDKVELGPERMIDFTLGYHFHDERDGHLILEKLKEDIQDPNLCKGIAEVIKIPSKVDKSCF